MDTIHTHSLQHSLTMPKTSSFKNIMKIVTSKIVIFARAIKLANIHHYLLQIDLTCACLISKPTSTPLHLCMLPWTRNQIYLSNTNYAIASVSFDALPSAQILLISAFIY